MPLVMTQCLEGVRRLWRRACKPVSRKGKALLWVIRIAILALIGGTALGILIAEILLRLPRSISGAYPAGHALPWEEVEIPAVDGVRLRGWWMRPDETKGTIIVCHGHGADKGDALVFANFLRQAGFSVLVTDFRGHGESDGLAGSLGFYEVRDVQMLVDWLSAKQEIPNGKLGVFGYSMGGSIALLAAAEDSRIRAVVADSAFADAVQTLRRFLRQRLPLPRFPVIWAAIRWAEWRLGCDYSSVSPEDRISRISPRPVLLIHGEKDRLIPVEDSRRLFEAARDPKELWIVPEVGHLGSYDAVEEDYRRRVVEFFEQAMAANDRQG